MTINLSRLAELGEELIIDSAGLTGSADLIGTLLHNPVHIVFDNQSTVAISIGNKEDEVWHTFPAGEALVLDMRANHGIADNYTFRQGMSFFATGAAGTGDFSISYTYAVPQGV
jgi:hypothetical protein